MYNHYNILVKEMGDDIPPMIEAQRDFTKLEMEYFEHEMKSFLYNFAAALVVATGIASGYLLYIGVL
jgi:hypothetical protein